MESDYLFESLAVVGKKPMAMLPTEEVNVFKIRFYCCQNPDVKIDITTSAESYWAQGLLDKIKSNTNQKFSFDLV